jgi:hypothetical protein
MFRTTALIRSCTMNRNLSKPRSLSGELGNRSIIVKLLTSILVLILLLLTTEPALAQVRKEAKPSTTKVGDGRDTKPASTSESAKDSTKNEQDVASQDKPKQATDNQNDPTDQQLPKSETLYVGLTVHRQPQMSAGEITISQNLRYRILLKLDVTRKDNDQTQRTETTVKQTVLNTYLDEADELSKETFAAGLKDLLGKEMTFQVNLEGVVEKFEGAPINNTINLLKALGGEGFMVSNVLDQDGWKELARLVMFQPRISENEWNEDFEHNWGPIGSWTGRSVFRRGKSQKNIQQYSYQHDIQYKQPDGDAAALPFATSELSFSVKQFGGVIKYDPQLRRVVAIKENFVVGGGVKTELYGITSEVTMTEGQSFTVEIYDQNQWDQLQKDAEQKGNNPKSKRKKSPRK